MTLSHVTKTILAVDGGGTKTEIWLARVAVDEADSITSIETLSRTETGPTNPRSVGFAQAFSTLDDAFRELFQKSDCDGSRVDSACISLAGAGRSIEQDRIHAWATDEGIARRIRVVDDVAPLRLAAEFEWRQSIKFRGHPDSAKAWSKSITLVSGTGSIGSAFDSKQGTCRVGGWGYLLGDEGSGFDIGLSALKSICDSFDRRGMMTPMQEEILQRLQVSLPAGLVEWIYQPSLPRPAIAALASIVLSHADRESTARAIVHKALGEWVKRIQTLAHRCDFLESEFSLALSGGVFKNSPDLVRQLTEELSEKQLLPRIVHVVAQPIYGALMLALE